MKLTQRTIRTDALNGNNHRRYKKLSLIGERCKDIISEISNPIDSTNRFINLALNVVGDSAQSRQFLLESKQGIKKAVELLKKLTDYSEKIEKELKEMVEEYE